MSVTGSRPVGTAPSLESAFPSIHVEARFNKTLINPERSSLCAGSSDSLRDADAGRSLVYSAAVGLTGRGSRAGCRNGRGRLARMVRPCRDGGISAGGRQGGSVRSGGLSVSSMIRATWRAGTDRIPVHQPETFGCGIPSRPARRLPDIPDRAIRERNSAGVIFAAYHWRSADPTLRLLAPWTHRAGLPAKIGVEIHKVRATARPVPGNSHGSPPTVAPCSCLKGSGVLPA